MHILQKRKTLQYLIGEMSAHFICIFDKKPIYVKYLFQKILLIFSVCLTNFCSFEKKKKKEVS